MNPDDFFKKVSLDENVPDKYNRIKVVYENRRFRAFDMNNGYRHWIPDREIASPEWRSMLFFNIRVFKDRSMKMGLF